MASSSSSTQSSSPTTQQGDRVPVSDPDPDPDQGPITTNPAVINEVLRYLRLNYWSTKGANRREHYDTLLDNPNEPLLHERNNILQTLNVLYPDLPLSKQLDQIKRQVVSWH